MNTEKEVILHTRAGDLVCQVRRTRRKTYAVVVTQEGAVQIRMPLRGSVRKGLQIAKESEDWILEKIALQQGRQSQRQRLLEEREKRFTPSQRDYLEKKYRAAAREYIPKRARYYADILGVDFTRVRIAEQKTRWGSCSESGTLSFHWKLMLAPARVLDYVIVHEVCHLKEMNHSKAFWAWVAFLMPGFEESRKWLQKHGEELQYY